MLNDLKGFIDSSQWIFAKTYAKTWPHEYIVQEKVDRKLFDKLAEYIDRNGISDFFYQKQRLCER